ncbi:MAG: tRNA 2-selenouridine(34) synthase MnmH [Pyrinomonadaceae bacterium]|nr:tRNA 2-selenouridine(34) synthase MnmH [Pyrinomonadaceae bacterium]
MILEPSKRQSNLISIDKFRLAPGTILDVRSPAEFAQGHIPGAQNLPLFSNEERAQIGICYKEKGQEAAIQLGHKFVDPRRVEMIRKAGQLAGEGSIRLHCWRGGLRSKGVGRLLEDAGFDVRLLEGGYKSYRRWARDVVGAPRRISILTGLTGTGKTRILKSMREQGIQTLDLEGLANHRGSSFGGLGMPPQPTTQYFENLIAERLVEMDPDLPVWIEAESSRIGTCCLPEELFSQMRSAPAIAIARPINERLDILTEMYGEADGSKLIEATKRISQRLGGQRTKSAIDLISENDLRGACRLILDYYDRTYTVHRKRRGVSVPEIDVGGLSATDAAAFLLEKAPSLVSSFSQSA